MVLVGEARTLLVTDTPEPAPTPTDDLDDDWADDEEDPDGDEGVDPYDGFLPGAGAR